MKNFLLVILLGVAFVSCSKKESNPNADSNLMMDEPEVKIVTDSTKIQPETAATKVDSASIAVDSTKQK